MKIVHIAPNAIYDDYWGYHENLLPKYHKKAGHEVVLFVNTKCHNKTGIGFMEEGDYFLNDGVRVIRRKIKTYMTQSMTSLFSKMSIYEDLVSIAPDFIFFHGLCSTTMSDCIQYKKWAKANNKQCTIVQDNHLDYNNSGTTKTLKQKMARAFYRLYHKKNRKYIAKVYGVTPWRVLYAQEHYKIPANMTELLIMGADDDSINFENRQKIRTQIREEHQISNEDFLIVTGGKIDRKKNVLQLMEACAGIEKVKLLIFGSVANDVKAEFEELLGKSSGIVYVGWIDSTKVYDYFFAADIVFFAGGHSVLWEQACATKTPCVFQRIEGMEHVNNGGNCDFLDNVSAESIRNKIVELLFTEAYMKMKEVASSEATDVYLYSKIAEKSLECSPQAPNK